MAPRRFHPGTGSGTPASEGWAFLLVHGGQLDGACWELVQPLLAAPSLAVSLPGRPSSRLPDLVASETEKLAYVREDVASLGVNHVVVVGHSAAGAVLPALASSESAVRHTVHISCLIAPPGGTTHDAVPRGTRAYLRVYLLWQRARGRSHQVVVGPGPIRRRLGNWIMNDVPEDRRPDLLRQFVPEPNGMQDLRAPLNPPTVACSVVLLLRDRVVNLRQQTKLIRGLGTVERIAALDTGHFPMVSRPVELAAILDEIMADAQQASEHALGKGAAPSAAE